MKIKINEYNPASYTTSNTNTTITDIPESESFEEVLVLNQTALKAMAIDAMVAESATGSISPDAVDAAAIMKFRNTLASHIVAPIPEENNWNTKKHAASINKGNTSIKETAYGVYDSGALNCSDELNAYFAEAAELYDIDVKLLKSIAFCESSFDPNNTSSSGAMGIMQLMPKTAEYLGVKNAYDPRENILGGAKYFASMLDRYDGDVSLALAAYNAGPGNVDKYGGIPPFEETQNYVPKVLGYYNS